MNHRRIGTLIAASLLWLTAPTQAAKVGETATGSTYHLLNGQVLSGQELRGMVVVLNFWGQDCRACDEQLKALDFYYRQRHQLGLVVLVASSDRIYDADLRAALKGYRIFGVRSVSGELQPLRAIPTTYIIDRTGKIRYAKAGAIGLDKLNELLVPIIREPQPPM